MTLPFDDPRLRREIAPGAVHLPGWLTADEQLALVDACRDWSLPPAGMRTIRVRGGAMSVRTVCLGWHWSPYRYTRFIDSERAKPFPQELGAFGRRAVTDAGLPGPYEPDVALINYYDAGARMGMHQDRDERSAAPVVSLSLGDTAVFRFGNTADRNRPYTDVALESGDLFVFGGAARLAYHGITRVLPGSGSEIGLAGRLNITLRESGMR
ncbi:MAG TPA: alpha-ketoglutarate-dependent dioxygenase AlkB [Jatrophihabitantaceae bacterium]|nr:alpha-ketoglutarate-dependent dioxygenase AlkB [Jatrophihabitantaceae bacterium]